jgi:hypothetical protein
MYLALSLISYDEDDWPVVLLTLLRYWQLKPVK